MWINISEPRGSPRDHRTRKGDAYAMIAGVSRKSRNAHTPGTTPQLTPQVVFADAENLRFLLTSNKTDREASERRARPRGVRSLHRPCEPTEP